MHMKKKGFTLVELSIVLVIIGLLIGGILVGQSLVNSAKINGVIREVSELEVNFHLFKQRYKYFPGDYSKNNSLGWVCGNPAVFGNGDGTLSNINESFIAFTALNAGLGTNYPSCQFNCNNYASIGQCGSTGYYFKGGKNVLKSKKWDKLNFNFNEQVAGGSYVGGIQLGADNPTTSFARPGYILSGIDAFTFDAKIDDGQYNTGKFATNYSYGSNGDIWFSCFNGSNYNKTSGVQNCFAPTWKIEANGPNTP